MDKRVRASGWQANFQQTESQGPSRWSTSLKTVLSPPHPFIGRSAPQNDSRFLHSFVPAFLLHSSVPSALAAYKYRSCAPLLLPGLGKARTKTTTRIPRAERQEFSSTFCPPVDAPLPFPSPTSSTPPLRDQLFRVGLEHCCRSTSNLLYLLAALTQPCRSSEVQNARPPPTRSASSPRASMATSRCSATGIVSARAWAPVRACGAP